MKPAGTTDWSKKYRVKIEQEINAGKEKERKYNQQPLVLQEELNSPISDTLPPPHTITSQKTEGGNKETWTDSVENQNTRNETTRTQPKKRTDTMERAADDTHPVSY